MSSYKTGLKIRVAKDSLDEIKDKANLRGWNANNNREPQIQATQYLFRQQVQKIIESAPPMGHEVVPVDGLFYKLTEIFKSNYLNQLGTLISQYEESESKYIKVEGILNYIREETCKAEGISRINWNNFRNGKEIPKNAFIAFCYTLGISNWERVAELPEIYRESDNDEKKFVDGLSLFNHQGQIRSVFNALREPKQIFFISNQCLYSTTWMLKRIEKDLEIKLSQSTYSFSLNTSSRNPRPLEFILEEKVKPKINDLMYNNLLFVVNIDNYDLDRLESFIIDHWCPLIKRTSRYDGRAFLFLVDNQKLFQWQTIQENKSLCSQIAFLESANPFDKNHILDLEDVLRNLEVNMRRDLGRNLGRVAETIIQRSNGNTVNLLQKLYQEFNITNAELEKTWTQYP